MKKILLIVVGVLLAGTVQAHPHTNVKEQVAKVKKDVTENRCHIYRIEYSGNYYIVNSCGGIVLEPKATGTTRTR